MTMVGFTAFRQSDSQSVTQNYQDRHRRKKVPATQFTRQPLDGEIALEKSFHAVGVETAIGGL